MHASVQRHSKSDNRGFPGIRRSSPLGVLRLAAGLALRGGEYVSLSYSLTAADKKKRSAEREFSNRDNWREYYPCGTVGVQPQDLPLWPVTRPKAGRQKLAHSYWMSVRSKKGEVESLGIENMDSVLKSWREIAHYLKAEIRTVQRWENFRGLPVYRAGGTWRAPHASDNV